MGGSGIEHGCRISDAYITGASRLRDDPPRHVRATCARNGRQVGERPGRAVAKRIVLRKRQPRPVIESRCNARRPTPTCLVCRDLRRVVALWTVPNDIAVAGDQAWRCELQRNAESSCQPVDTTAGVDHPARKEWSVRRRHTDHSAPITERMQGATRLTHDREGALDRVEEDTVELLPWSLEPIP